MNFIEIMLQHVADLSPWSGEVNDMSESFNDFETRINTVKEEITEIDENAKEKLEEIVAFNIPDKFEAIENIRGEIVNINSTVTMISAKETARLEYDRSTGEFKMFVPRAEAFKIDEVDVLANRTNFDDELSGFVFFAKDTNLMYFKKSDGNADWTNGIYFYIISIYTLR